MNKTLADQFLEDSSYQQAKGKILESLAEYQSRITGIRPPIAELRQKYEDILEVFQKHRAGTLIFPYLGSGIGAGPFVELADGSIKYDFIAGIGVYQFGHCHPEIVASSLDAAVKDTLIQGHVQQTTASAELTGKLLNLANREGHVFDHCYLTSSGVMSGENALKITFQKKSPAKRILAFNRCFAGRTLAFSQINDKPALREGLPEYFPIDHVPFFDPEDPEGSTNATLSAIDALVEEHPGEYAAMFFELVQGEGGFYPGNTDFFRTIMQYCKDHGIAVLVDEVQTFGRLSKPFAFQYYGLHDLVDVAWIGKASQVCATFFKESFSPKPILLGQTYTAATSVIEGALTILNHWEQGDYFGDQGKIEALSKYMRDQLKSFANETGLIEGPFGIGSMICFTPGEGDNARVFSFAKKLFEQGVISLTAGSDPSKIRFLLPYPAIEEQHIDEVLKITFDLLRSGDF